MKRLSGLVVSVGVLATAAVGGCNSLLGIDEPVVVDGSGNGGDGNDGGDGECVLNSECSKNEVCLFEVCSPPCEADRDCAAGARCLKTKDGTACVVSTGAACDAETACPEGSTCVAETCRITCDGTEDCLADQVCQSGACYGNDTTRDPDGGPCEADETRCGVGGRLETCDADGAWGDGIECPFLCSKGECTGDCKPEAVDCKDGKIPLECSAAGKWVEKEECAAVCTDGACAASCDVGTYECSTKDRLVCNDDGVWERDETCPFVCNPSTSACDGECEPGTRSCAPTGETLRVCGADGFWDVQANCVDVCIVDATATGGFACAACDPGTDRCRNNEVEQCSATGAWTFSSNCTVTDETCQNIAGESACAGECSPSQTECQGWDAYECNATGTFVLSDDCTEPTEICRGGVCENNTAYNLGDASTSGWTSPYSALANTLYAVPVTPTRKVDVQSIRLQLTAAGVSVAFGIYQDDGSNRPGARVGGTSPITTGAGVNSANTSSTVTLNAGVKYWVTMLFSANVTTQYKSGSGYSTPSAFPSLPNPYPLGSASAESYVWPLYLLVRDTAN